MNESNVARRDRRLTSRRMVVVFAALLMGVTGCGAQGGPAKDPAVETASTGDAATWQVGSAPEPTAEGATLHLGVTRHGCANGVTGKVLEPTIVVEHERVIISTPVEQFSGGADCPSNDEVPLEVHLGPEALGKDLVDAACLSSGGAASTSACLTGPARWYLPTTAAVEEVVTWTAPDAYSFQVTSLCGERTFVGTFEIDVAGNEAISVTPLGEQQSDVAKSDAMTMEAILSEASGGIRDGRTVRVALDQDGHPRYVSIGDDLAQSDTTSCYFVHDLWTGSTQG